MKFFEKINLADYIISAIISVFLTCYTYSFLYPLCKYNNLNDFYIGTSIYYNHNKSLDIFIILLYIILFLIIAPVIISIRTKFIKKNILNINYENITFTEKYKLLFNKYKDFFCKIQYVFAFGYLLLYPINSNIYPHIILLISILILITIYDSYKRNKNKEGFSPFTAAAILLIIFFKTYTTNVQIDEHHMGETFATFFLHSKYHLQYYKDIMLVHGYIDIIPSQLGKIFFNNDSLYSYLLGDNLFKNLLLIFNTITCCYIFKNNKFIAVSAIALIQTANSVQTDIILSLIIIYIAFLNKKFTAKPVLWLSVYVVTAFYLSMFWTTIGTFWIISTIPVLIYVLYKNFKSNYKYKYLNILIPFILFLILFHTHKTELHYFILEAKEYAKSTLFAFGNDFMDMEQVLYRPIEVLQKTFCILILPVLLILLFKSIRDKENSPEKTLILLFSILFPLVSLKYTIGRIDAVLFTRLFTISYVYLFFLVPLYVYFGSDDKLKNKFAIVYFILAMAVSVFPVICNIKTKTVNIIKTYNSINNTAENSFFIPNQDSEYIPYIQQKTNKAYLDISNKGLNYLFLDKAMPVKYTSFYNSITSKQAFDSQKKAESVKPDVITLFNNPGQYSYVLDNIYPSLRINALYRWILLSKIYKPEEFDGKNFLIKANNKIEYSKDDIYNLDYTLSTSDLKYLPEVWGNSIKTLPITNTDISYKLENIDETKNIIKIKTPFSGKNIDFIFIETSQSDISQTYKLSINGSNSVINCSSESGKILVPLDNYPSWLLNENVNEITIITEQPAKIINIEFFNKIENIR